jgi:UTP--glucose-1-phosphate uridylyltransferase
MSGRVRKAVLPAAGLGTRLYPATRAVPKAMLPVMGRPVIEYIVDEARAAGIERVVIVTGPLGDAIENHFKAPHSDLPAGTVSFARQPRPLGLGHAVWCAREFIDGEPFAVLTADVIMRGEPGGLAQILQTYERVGGNVVSVEECAQDQTGRYGIVAPGDAISEAAFRIDAMVEKPPPGAAPSNLKISGRYILQPRILDLLAQQKPGAGGEIQLTDAMVRLATEQRFFGHRFKGRFFDCGSREGLLAANIAFALEDPLLSQVVRRETGP